MKTGSDRMRAGTTPSRFLPRGIAAAALAALWIAVPGEPLMAADAPARNREGNRLFAEGRFAEAEKAYRQAQEAAPGRPELLYNTGNALLKQKNYASALQSLKEAMNSGDPRLRAQAWFNSGNALFESGRFKEAVDAYTQSLRLAPADRDAKHNLELALRQQQQEQKNRQQDQSGQQQPRDQQQGQKGEGQSGEQKRKPEPEGEQPQPQASDREQNKPADPRATSADNADQPFTRERALQILDALRNQELVEQKKLLESRAKRKPRARDW